jgi:hypothetical protein
MPEFGSVFDADTHGMVAPDAAKLIIYRDPDIDERIKPSVNLKRPFLSGYTFAGAFLEVIRAPGTQKIWGGYGSTWTENPPVGEFIGARRDPGERTPTLHERWKSKRESKIFLPILEFEVEAGTVSYLRLKRSETERIEKCAESDETINMCSYVGIEITLEIVPPDEAQRELAGLKETVYAEAK